MVVHHIYITLVGRPVVEDLNQLYVRNAAGDMVPLRTLIRVKPTLGPLNVTRYNQFPSATINATPQTASTPTVAKSTNARIHSHGERASGGVPTDQSPM